MVEIRRFPTVSAMTRVIDEMMRRFPVALGPDVAVSDGIYLGGDETDQLLQVGVEDPDSVNGRTTSASSRIEWRGLGALARDEILQIRCLASAKSGDADPRAARNKAFHIVEGCQHDLTRDPMVGGSVYSWITEITLQQQQNPNGAYADVLFVVQCRVLIERGLSRSYLGGTP